MTIYLVESLSSSTKAFINRQLAELYLKELNLNSISISYIIEIELITDQFMEQILQPKESHETNTNSSL